MDGIRWMDVRFWDSGGWELCEVVWGVGVLRFVECCLKEIEEIRMGE